MEFSQSERPGSNRPPRPWQGRALPNELLPHIILHKNFSGDGKSKQSIRIKNGILLVFRSIQRISGNNHLGFAFIPVRIQSIAGAD